MYKTYNFLKNIYFVWNISKQLIHNPTSHFLHIVLTCELQPSPAQHLRLLCGIETTRWSTESYRNSSETRLRLTDDDDVDGLPAPFGGVP
jgi:hypothetical protein